MTYREVTYYQATAPAVVVHGPMWQAECTTCDWMGDALDTETGAKLEMADHVCRPMTLEEVRRRDG